MRSLNIKLAILFIVTCLLAIFYLFYGVNYDYFNYVMSLRIPKVFAIIISGFAIATSTVVFQSIAKNKIMTPAILGMDALYAVIHTIIFFVLGSTSVIVLKANYLFFIDLVIMSVVATMLYGYLFKKTSYNVLYVLLIGAVVSTLFSSITDSLVRIMDPSEYDVLLNTLLASFDNPKDELLLISLILVILIPVVFWKHLRLLNVTSLGRSHAINLGVDYDKTISRLLIVVALYVSISTALVGPLIFLGLVAISIAREIFKTYDHKYLIIASALIGISLLFFGQFLIEHVFNFSTVITVFINIFGGIYFLYLIMKEQRRV